MSNLSRPQRSAIEAIARRFSATWGESDDPRRAWIAVGGKRIAVDLATLKQRHPDRDNATKPHLRFDRVATGLIQRLQAAFSEIAPPGLTMTLTVTAPILLPAKTTDALKEKINILLRLVASKREEKCTVHGNRVQMRLLRNKPERASKLVGFVHNPETDPLSLLDMTQEWIESIDAIAERTASAAAEDRWLVGITSRRKPCLAVYRCIEAQLGMTGSYEKIFLVFGDGGIEPLTREG